MSHFGAKDLSLFLSDEVEVVSSRSNKAKDETETFKELVPKIDKSKKVTRYFPQKAPAWLSSQETSDASQTVGKSVSAQGEDKRLARLSRFTDVSAGSTRRKRYEAQVIEKLDDEEEERSSFRPDESVSRSIDVDAIEEEEEAEEEPLTYTSREGHLHDRVPSASRVFPKTEVKQEVSEEESEYETDSEEEEEREILKPVFVPKSKRETIFEYERKLAEEEALQEKKLRALEERKQQSRVLVAESVRRLDAKNETDATDADSDAGMPDDTDNLDEEEEVALLLPFCIE